MENTEYETECLDQDQREPACIEGEHDWDNDTNCGSSWSRNIFRATGIETRAYGDPNGYHGARICRKCGCIHSYRYTNGVGRSDSYSSTNPDIAAKLRAE